MSSLSEPESKFVNQCISRVSNGRSVRAACVYGSRVAGYSRPDSDIDVLIVLDRYPYSLKYAYFRSREVDVSALVVDANALLKDATKAVLGEFVIGRLLHVYEPLSGALFLQEVERVYKKRVILEEMNEIIAASGVLGTELMFPLEYVHFSKIKKRVAQYPAAAFSYYKTYSLADNRNIEFALEGYRRALAEIISEDAELVNQTDGLLQVSRARVSVVEGQAYLRLARRLSLPISSFVVLTYAGRKVLHLMMSEAESKIKRRFREPRRIPVFIANPRKEFWKLPEGEMITGVTDWLVEFANRLGIDNYVISRRRLGNINSRTILFTLQHNGSKRNFVVKRYARRKSIKWAALSVWTSPVRTFRIEPLLRLGSEYIALRYIRQQGLFSPSIEAVVLDRRLLIMAFVEGATTADKIKSFLTKSAGAEIIEAAGKQIAQVHARGSSFGNLKPKNIISSGSALYFTDLEQFALSGGDQVWDIAQFVCWGLKHTSGAVVAGQLVGKFLDGYMQSPDNIANVKRLSRSRRYIESFYPVLTLPVARAIKSEISKRAG